MATEHRDRYDRIVRRLMELEEKSVRFEDLTANESTQLARLKAEERRIRIDRLMSGNH